MSWLPVSAATLFDVAIVGTICVTVAHLVRRAYGAPRRSGKGVVLVVAGLTPVAMLYIGHLVAIQLPEGPVAETLRALLNSNLEWFVRVFAIASICVGVVVMQRSMAKLIFGLEDRERDLARELAERKRADHALMDREQLLDSIFENVPVGLLIKDTNLVIERPNRTYLRWYGLDADELVGRTSRNIEGLERTDEISVMAAQERSVAATGENQSRQIERPFADGSIHTLHITKFPILDSEGRITRVGSVSVDMTEQVTAERRLRESEDRYRYVFEFSPYAIYIHDGDRFIDANAAAARTYGYASVEAMIGQKVRDIIHPEEWERFNGRLAQVFDLEPLPMVEERRVRKDGRVIRVIQSGTPIPWGDGHAILGINRDITRERENEQQLRQAQKMETVGQLTAGIAHDFNNILAVIMGNCELLEQKLAPDDPQAAAILKASQRAAELTHRLLAFSRKQMLDPTIVDGNAVVRNVVELLRRTLEEHIDIEVIEGDDLWPCKVDAAQLESALFNLAVNARDAMPDGGRLTIRTENIPINPGGRAASGAGYIMIAVDDTGSGIPAEHIDQVFEPFFTTKGAGSGLGLSMVYGFVNQSGGRVEIDNRPGGGASVEIYLPRSDAEEDRSSPTKDLDSVPSGLGETVLVVEDDPDVRRVATEQLRALGYGILEAENAAAAMDLMTDRADAVDLVLTDVILTRGMNGRALAEEIRQRAPNTPVLFMSGYAEDDFATNGRTKVGAKLLRKPFDRDELARAVRSTIDDGPQSMAAAGD